LYEPWGAEKDDALDYNGMTPTGATNCFEITTTPKRTVENTFNTYYAMPDTYMICPMRFNKWFRCDMVHGKDRMTDYDMNPNRGLTNLKKSEHYPCFREFYETIFACSDNLFEMLMELAYHKKARNFWRENMSSV
jgi:hypothetical protein